MKSSALFFLSVTISTLCSAQIPATSVANNLQFKTILKQTFDQFDSANDFNNKIRLSNKLSLIANKWTNEWVAHYYLSYSKAMLSSEEKDDDKRDAYLDAAEKEHNLAIAVLGKENDETYVLTALIANWRIAISPMFRSGKYAGVFRSNLSKAKELNPQNPRIYFLEGAAKFAMPRFVGGGKDAALPYLSKADSLYEKENSNDIEKPYWGKAKNSNYLNQCRTN